MNEGIGMLVLTFSFFFQRSLARFSGVIHLKYISRIDSSSYIPRSASQLNVSLQ